MECVEYEIECKPFSLPISLLVVPVWFFFFAMHTTSFGRQTALAATGRTLRSLLHSATPRHLFRRTAVAWAAAACTSWAVAQTSDVPAVDASTVPAHHLPEINVVAEQLPPELGSTHYGKQDIDSTPGGNGDITSVLVRHPGVQFDNAALSADTAGDIGPANISIHGAKFYDNQFMLDGASINSTISGGVQFGAENDTPKEDSSLGLAVDTRLLCNISVLDANVSAAYGRFMGGVVNAEVCAPTKKLGGGVSLEYSSSKWMEKKFDGPGNELSTDISKQNRFRKWTWRGNMEAQISDSLGIVGSVSRKTSTIPLMAYDRGAQSTGDSQVKDAKHQIDNFFLKAFFKPGGGITGDASIMYSPSVTDSFRANAKNSDYHNESGGLLLSAGLSIPVGNATFNQKISYKETDSSRYSSSNEYLLWRYSPGDKNWAPPGVNGYTTNTWSREGGFGDIEQQDKTLSYKWDMKLAPVQWGLSAHSFTVGGELEWDRFAYERLNDYTQYTAARYTTTCNVAGGGVDTKYCSLAPVYGQKSGQYMSTRLVYRAGRVEHDSRYAALYLEDAIRWDRLQLRLGVRLENASDAMDAVWAPRLSATYQLGAAREWTAEAGLNRYYGQSLKAYQIYAQKLTLKQGTETRGAVSGGVIPNWTTGSQAVAGAPDALKLPYADELALGLGRDWSGLHWQAKYVHRKSKDEVVMVRGAAGTWDNQGHSKTDSYSLSVSTLTPWELARTQTTLSVVWDYAKSQSTHYDWSTAALDEDGIPSYVLYQGQLMPAYALPAQNYHRPWTLRVMSSTEIPQWGARLDGILRLRQAYRKVGVVERNVVTDVGKVSRYGEYALPKSVTFDVRLTKNWQLSHQRKLYAELSVENLFNRSNAYDYDADTRYYQYEKGRQATIRVGYEF